jgi:hypothetical protein
VSCHQAHSVSQFAQSDGMSGGTDGTCRENCGEAVKHGVHSRSDQPSQAFPCVREYPKLLTQAPLARAQC